MHDRWCACARDMHLADMSLVAYPSQNPSEATLAGRGGGEGGEDRGKIYRIYYSGKTQGRKDLLYSEATISREWIFPMRLPLSSSLLLFLPASPSPENGITIIRFVSSHIHTYTLITPRTGNAARYFVTRTLWIQTRTDRNACLESADVSFIIPSR